MSISDEERAAFKQSEMERIADLHPGVDKLLVAERRATVERIGSAYLASQVPDGSEEFYRGIDAASANLRAILDEVAK